MALFGVRNGSPIAEYVDFIDGTRSGRAIGRQIMRFEGDNFPVNCIHVHFFQRVILKHGVDEIVAECDRGDFFGKRLFHDVLLGLVEIKFLLDGSLLISIDVEAVTLEVPEINGILMSSNEDVSAF